MARDRVGVVTGAAGGIGQALVGAMVERGMRVLAVDRQDGPLRALDAAIAEKHGPGRTRGLAADLCAADASERIVDAAIGQFGAIDVLVNNAGIGQHSLRPGNWDDLLKFWEIEPVQWQQFFAVHSTATFLLSRLAVRRMLAQGWGRIVNVTTSLGSMTRGGYVPYGPSKAAAESLTSMMAYDLEGTGVTANVLVPGGVTNTGMILDGSGLDRNQMLQPDVMVAPLLFLISDEAGAINGQRFVASNWDKSLPAAAAAAKAGAPVAWRSIATMPIIPPSRGK